MGIGEELNGGGGNRNNSESSQNLQAFETSGAKSGAVAIQDLDLLKLIEAWPTLSKKVKSALLAIVECSY